MASSQVLTPTHEYPFAFAGPKPIMDPKERFYRQFQQEAVNIQEAIGQLSSIPKIGGERQDATDSILASISQLSNEVSDASDFVPAYDLRSYSQAVKALTDQLNEETAKLAPKTKFQFKPRAANITGVPKAGDDEFVPLPSVRGVPSGLAGPQPAADVQASSSIQSEKRDSVGDLPSFPSKDYNAEMAKPGSSGVRKPSFSAARDVNISDHTGLHIILPSTASRATSSGSLTGLTGCVVDMSVPTAGQSAFAGLAIKSISKSLIVAGHVNGPAHITGVSDSIVVVAARQVRIHECNNVDFYLHCGSRPIIEDCSGVRFAPIPACYLGKDVDPSTNQWDQVDDFKWLKAEHSPNWKILPAEERLAEEIWTKTVPGGPGVGTDDVLKKVGISSR